MKTLPLLLLCALLAGCGPDTDEPTDEGLFSRPFAGAYRNNWPFDHEYPLNAFSDACKSDAADHALTWRGELLQLDWNTRCHDGHDWGLPDNTPLYAVAAGEVIFAGEDRPVSCGSKGQVRALLVRIRHSLFADDDYETLYAHLNRIDVRVGQRVSARQRIGLSGSTGCVSGPHLHFGVYRLTQTNNGQRTPVDPFGWNGSGSDPWSTHADGANSIFLWNRGAAPAGDYNEVQYRE